MKRLTLIFLLLTSSVLADATATITRVNADSSATLNLNNLEIPRWQMATTTKNGQVVWYMSPISGDSYYPAANVKFLIGTGLKTVTPTWSRYTATGYGTASNSADHLHLHSYKDTLYASKFDDRNSKIYFVDTTANTMSLLASVAPGLSTETDQMVVALYPLPLSDTVIRISRSSGDAANTNNVRLWYSADNGVTYGSASRVRDWSTYAGRKRIGLFPYGNSVGFVGDSGDVAVCISTFNRATASWTDWGQAITVATDGYRSFGASTIEDTTIVVGFTKIDVDGAGGDSLLTAWRNAGGTSWTRLPAIYVGSGTASGTVPYMQFTYIESSKRLVMFYTKNFSGDPNNYDIYCRYLLMPGRTWSQEYQITSEGARGSQSYKFATAPLVRSNHGDACYVGYVYTRSGQNVARLAMIEWDKNPTTTITSLPYTISQSNRTYIINSDLSSASDGLLIADGVHDVIVEGNNYTISFGTAGTTYTTLGTGTGPYGFRTSLTDSSWNITVRNLKFWHTPPRVIWEDPTLISRAIALRWGGGGSHGYRFENCDFKVIGRNTMIMYGDNSSPTRGHYNNDFVNCIWRDSMAAFLRRDYWDEQTMIDLISNNTAKSRNPSMSYHWRFQGCSTAVAFWSNVHLEGDSTVAIFDNCAWITDGWNRLNGTSIAHPSMTTATENYCIALRQGDPAIEDGVRIKIHNNRFYSGTEHSGGRGIFISGVEGINWNFEDSCIAITDNQITVHQGYDGYTTTVKGIIAREGFGGIRITGNTIDIPIYYGTAPNSSYGPGPSSGIEITANPGYETLIKGNVIQTYFVDAFTHSNIYSAPGAYPIAFIETWMDSLNGTNGLPNNRYLYVHNIKADSNRLVTNHVFLRYGSSNGPGGDPTTIGDTLEYYGGTSPNNSNTYVVMKQYATDPATAPAGANASYGTFLQDPVVLSGITETRFSISETEPRPYSMGTSATLTVTVRNSSNQPVNGATVTVTDRYNLTKATGTTDANGLFSYVLPYYQQFGGTIGTTPDSTYNPYVVQASYLSAGTATTNHTLTATNKAVTLYLGSTPETPAEPRTKITGGVHISGGVIIP